MPISSLAPPYPGTGRGSDHREKAMGLYRSLLSAEVVEGVVQFYDIMVPGKQRSGKTYTESKVIWDGVRWHPQQQKNGELAVFVNRKFSVLSNKIKPALDDGKRVIFLGWDDPINEESFSRWGTSREKGRAVMDFMEIAHQECLELAEREHRTAIIYLVYGPQDLGIFERVYREPSMSLVKSPNIGTQESVLKLLRSRWDIYEQLWENYIEYTYKQQWEKKSWNALVAGPYVEWIHLPPPEILYCERGSEWWVPDEVDEGAPSIDLESMVEELIEWADLRLPYRNPEDTRIKKYVFDSAKAFLLEGYQYLFMAMNKNTGVYAVKQKAVEDTADQLRSMVLGGKNRALLLQQQSNGDGADDAETTDDPSPLYAPILKAIENDTTVFKRADGRENAARVLKAYMGHWGPNEKLPAAQRHTPSMKEISNETGISQSVGANLKKIKEFLSNGRLIEKVVQKRLQGKMAEKGEIFAREGEHGPVNVHEPDIISNQGRVFGVKFMFGDPRRSDDRTASYDIENDFRPEKDACITGKVSTERFGNGREAIKVEETFTVAFAALGWGDFITLVDVDPRKHRKVRFRYDTLEGEAT